MTPYEAGQNLDTIRMLMERAGRYSNFSGISCATAGALAIAASGICRWRDISFEVPNPWWKLISLWAAVLVVSFLQNVFWTWVHARRQKQRIWTHLTRTMTLAVLPGFFTGGVLTGFAITEKRLDMLPGVWMMTYGVEMMAASFGLLHIGLGLLIAWKYRV